MSDLAVTCPEGADSIDGASKSGDYRIEWEAPDGAVVRLLETHPGGDDDIIYEGEQRASTVTGRPEGDYHYKVGLVETEGVARWSEPCTVLVRPYPLSLALSFFGAGLLVTVATVTLILRGHRAHKRGELG